MKKISALCLSTLLGCTSFYALADESTGKDTKADTSKVQTPAATAIKALKEVAPYPEATADQKRYAIFLEPKEKEELFKVELVFGKTIEVDSCNRYMIGGSVDQKTLEGFGYDYFVVEQVGMPASTMMACQDNKKHQAFVPLTTQTFTRYNSKLPLVVYAPKDVEVRYRLWSANQDTMAAPEAK